MSVSIPGVKILANWIRFSDYVFVLRGNLNESTGLTANRSFVVPFNLVRYHRLVSKEKFLVLLGKKDVK